MGLIFIKMDQFLQCVRLDDFYLLLWRFITELEFKFVDSIRLDLLIYLQLTKFL